MSVDVEITVSTPEAPVWAVNTDRPGYAVFLPHSCDEWVIADDPDPAEALAQLDRFIAALGEARARLAAASA